MATTSQVGSTSICLHRRYLSPPWPPGPFFTPSPAQARAGYSPKLSGILYLLLGPLMLSPSQAPLIGGEGDLEFKWGPRKQGLWDPGASGRALETQRKVRLSTPGACSGRGEAAIDKHNNCCEKGTQAWGGTQRDE